MKKYLPMFVALFLAGCASSSPAPQTHSNDDPLSPMAYQECIQAAMTGNGQVYNEKCDKILKETR